MAQRTHPHLTSPRGVRAALRSDKPAKYERAAKGSLVDAVEPQIRQQLALDPKMPATVNAERIGWTNSLTILKDRLRVIRPEYVGIDPADRIVRKPGESAQMDLWFPATPDGSSSRLRPNRENSRNNYQRGSIFRRLKGVRFHPPLTRDCGEDQDAGDGHDNLCRGHGREASTFRRYLLRSQPRRGVSSVRFFENRLIR